MTITDKQTGMSITGHAGQSTEKLKAELAHRVAMLKDQEPWKKKEKAGRLYDPLYGLVLEDEDEEGEKEGRKSKRERRFDRRVRP